MYAWHNNSGIVSFVCVTVLTQILTQGLQQNLMNHTFIKYTPTRPSIRGGKTVHTNASRSSCEVICEVSDLNKNINRLTNVVKTHQCQISSS